MSENGRVFGYARVSSTEQNLDRQIQAVNTDNLVHTARCFSARFPVIECILSAT